MKTILTGMGCWVVAESDCHNCHNCQTGAVFAC